MVLVPQCPDGLRRQIGQGPMGGYDAPQARIHGHYQHQHAEEHDPALQRVGIEHRVQAADDYIGGNDSGEGQHADGVGHSQRGFQEPAATDHDDRTVKRCR